jgi:two-component system, OmpR family, phosphate regulon sensor histidine kinase PhoR
MNSFSKTNLLPADLPNWPHFIIQSMADGVITVDGEMRVTDLNRAAEKLTDFTREEALGRFCGEVLQSSICGRECPLKMAMNTGEIISREAVLTNRLGRKSDVMLSASALRDDQGNLLGGVETFRDVAPLKHMENERRQLVSMFAHDLKAPVVAVAGLLNRLLRGKLGELNQRQTEYLETVHREMQRLENLITNFLDYSRLDLHIITPVISALQVEKECQEVINRLRPQAEEKGIVLQVEYPQEIVIIQADPVLFQRTLCNLMGNAIKYSPSQSRVTLMVSDMGEEVQFAVKDQGPGIDPQDLPHLFELLYRGKSSGQESGLGLGLAIVKRIIDAHGGRVWVESAEGQGAVFFFTLPRHRRD